MNTKFVRILFLLCLTIIDCIAFLNIFDPSVRKRINSQFSFGLANYYEVVNPTYESRPVKKEYDFIVVGGGSAGCVIAGRLSENPKWKILLLEAGGNEHLANSVPMGVAFLQGTDGNWGYKSVRQNNSCFGMRNNLCSLPRGKVLGGSSSINFMIYSRGNRKDFDRWSAAGNPGWSYNEVLPYFLKSEHAHLKGLENSKYHSQDGPLNVEFSPYRTKLVHAFVKAGIQSGLPKIDYNGESQIGISYVQATTLKGHRQSSAQSFLYPNRRRKNLHVMLFSTVTKILIDPSTKTAYGVQFSFRNKRYSVKARKEVILSAGVFNSPQILMLSGIGPAPKLTSLGIPVIKNLPVGRILYDHMSHLGPTFVVNTTGQTFYISDMNVRDVADFANGGGRLTTVGGVEGLAFLKTPNSRYPADYPDVELMFLPGSYANDEGTGLKEGANLRDEIYDTVFKPFQQALQDHFTVIVMQFLPLSYGTVELYSKDPFKAPRIDPNYFHNENDIETILQGIKETLRIMKAPAMQTIGARLHDIPVPGCEHLHFASDNYWRCSIRTLSGTIYHQISTCKMGPENDPTAVVNHELKVHGVNRLRVADTSIIPFPVTGHTNADAIMIGEKVSDMIKNTWK